MNIVSVYKDGTIIAPCSRFREFICKVHDENISCEVMVGKDISMTIKDLLPMQWDKM